MSALAQVLAEGAARLAAAGVESPRLDARVLMAHVLGKEQGELVGRADIPKDHMVRFTALIERRAKREPVAYIVGHKEFWSLPFAVGPGVLVPRPETETLVEQALTEFHDPSAPLKAIDFGTGSGCILLAFLCEFPNARGVGVERSPAAAEFARTNMLTLASGARCELLVADWKDSPAGPFDVVFANPPYLAQWELAAVRTELSSEPQSALVSGPDGLEAYRDLAQLIVSRLKPDGRAFLEIGATQAQPVAAILSHAGLEIIRVAPDLAGIPRCIVARPQKTVGIRRHSL